MPNTNLLLTLFQLFDIFNLRLVDDSLQFIYFMLHFIDPTIFFLHFFLQLFIFYFVLFYLLVLFNNLLLLLLTNPLKFMFLFLHLLLHQMRILIITVLKYLQLLEQFIDLNIILLHFIMLIGSEPIQLSIQPFQLFLNTIDHLHFLLIFLLHLHYLFIDPILTHFIVTSLAIFQHHQLFHQLHVLFFQPFHFFLNL